jgi:hypothetical protein
MFGQSLLSAFGSAACTTDTDQLFATDVQTTSVATYQFNNATTSIPSNTYPGTPSNITYAAGKFGNAAVFNGSSSKISLGTIGFGATSQITISMWLKPNSSQVASTQIIDRSHNTVGGWVIQQSGTSTNQYYFALHTNPPFKVSSTISLTANVWSHLVFTINASGNLNAYLNNVQVITGDTGYGSLNNSLNLETIISGYAGSSGRHFNGSIDQLRIFNTALPRAAVTALYNETTTTATSASVDYQLANPNSIAYYKMSDATDQLGNYNGTATDVNFNTEGKFGFAGAFNGTSSKINTGYIQTGQVYSASFWGKGFSAGASILRDTPAAGGANTFMDIATGANGQVIIGGNVALAPSYTPSTDWTHYAVVLDGTNATIYENGSQIATKTYTAKTGNNGTPVHMMSNGAYPAGFSGGYLDQVRIYDSALSAANVTALYNEIECPAVAVTNAFNTVLYTGNSGTQAVTGVGFKPDFTWIKRRNGTQWHNLFDSIRGVSERLFSNENNAQSFYNQSLTSFNSDGFSVGNDSDVNAGTLVSWNWKAPFANLSTGFNGSSSIITLPTALSDGTTTVANCISFWFNVGAEVTSSTTNNEIMTFAYSGGSSGKIALGSTSGSISNETFSVTSDVTSQYTYSRTNIPAGWNHAVVQWNSGTTKWDIYINGVAHTTYTFGTNEQGNFALKFGQRSSFYFNGSLNQIRVFNSILSASEISDLYAEPAASNNTLNYPAGAGCIAAYPLQTDAVDLSGNYNGASSNVTFGQPGYLTENTNGTIPSTVAANVDAGFSIVKWTTTSAAAWNVGHGLDTAPEMIISKMTSFSNSWVVYHKDVGTGKYLLLSTDAAAGTDSGAFSSVTDTTWTSYTTNTTGNYIAYCFTSIPGYSKLGSYSGGSSGSSNVIVIGFKPRFLIVKRTDQAGDAWQMFDSTMAGSDTFDDYLQANTNAAEASYNQREVNFTNNGFYWTYAESGTNISGGNYIFLAIA